MRQVPVLLSANFDAAQLAAIRGRPAYYPMFFPCVVGYDESLPRYEFDLARAKQLVAESGSRMELTSK